MLDLSDEQLASLTISDPLKAAIVESRRITQREARRRHLQYIGKIIRQEDDPEAVSRAIDAFHAGSDEHTRRHHLAERWREDRKSTRLNSSLVRISYAVFCLKKKIDTLSPSKFHTHRPLSGVLLSFVCLIV